MTWLVWLVLAVVLTAAAAVTGLKPKGTRPVAHTRMMGMARLVLVLALIVIAYFVLRRPSLAW